MRIRSVLNHGAASTALALALISVPAMAQEAPSDEEVIDEEAEEGDVITVTGSRIKNPSVENLEPTQFITDTYISDRNFINAADALNDLPVIRGSVTPNGGQGNNNPGVNFIDIFDLGTARTLTLVNGRRFVSSSVPGAANGLQVDINTVPTQLIERVDVVLIGGAPVYGSDAIAGTVNFVLKDDYEGLELGITSGITEEGDNFRYQVNGIWGTSFAEGRGNFVVSGFYSQEDGVLAVNRDHLLQDVSTRQNQDFGNAQPDGRVQPNIGIDGGADDGIPPAILFQNTTVGGITRGGAVLVDGAGSAFSASPNNLQFTPSGDLIPFVPGSDLEAFFESGGDGFRFVDFEQITTDIERLSLSTFANYDLTDNVNLYFEGQYFESRAVEGVEQPGFNTPLLGGGNGAAFFSINNPLLTDQARNSLIRAGIDETDGTFTVSRVNLDLANTAANAQNTLIRGVAGARGDFEGFGGNNWNYDVSFNYGRSTIEAFRQDIDLQNYVNALSGCDPTLDLNGDAAGSGIFPGSGLDPIADENCVPIALFGEGTQSFDAIEYVTANNLNRSVLEQWVVSANLGGDLFNLFGNAVSFNVGYEHRNESGDFQPSEFEQEGRGLEPPVSPIFGSFNLDEVFGEVLIPLFSPDNEFIFHSANIFGRGRYVDNSINGGFFAWSAGGSFSPIEDITFRGNFTRSFRAPAIGELFAPQVATTNQVPDLCSPGAIVNGAGDPENRVNNCNAFLAQFPNATPDPANNAAVAVFIGGNPNLDNEQADAYTFGVVVQPRFIRNLAISVDYIDIEVSDPIVTLTPGQVASACFDNPSFNAADPLNGNAFCSLIGRNPDGTVQNSPASPAVTTGTVNGAFLNYEGIEASANYFTSLENLGVSGRLSLRGNLTFVKRRFNSTTGIAPQRSDGTLGDPQFQGQLAANYNDENWGFGVVANYFGEQLFSRFNRSPDTREFDQLDDFVALDANIFFRTDDNFRFNLSVLNIGNFFGQRVNGFVIPGAERDALGRRFAVSVTKQF